MTPRTAILIEYAICVIIIVVGLWYLWVNIP